MPLETGSFINDLTVTNPPNSDPVGQGDDHLRLIKSCVQGTFPQMGQIFGQVIRVDTALSISSTWNTAHFICSASATATVVMFLPPVASITTGYHVDITTIGTGTVSIVPNGASSINGGTSLSVPRLSTCRAYFLGSQAWLGDIVPHGQGGTSVISNLAVDGTLSISGNATFAGTVSISGNATFSRGVSISASLIVTTQIFAGTGFTTTGTLTVSGTAVMAGLLSVGFGQIKFPSSQNGSADANTLDDYEEGTWTPTLTFATPGDLSVAYTTRAGNYTKIGDLVYLQCTIVTSSFTYTTSSGNINITGVPFAVSASNNIFATGHMVFSSGLVLGSPNVGSWVAPTLTTQTIQFDTVAYETSGNGAVCTTGVFPTGTNKTLIFGITYKTTT